jgi:hypothetical protein
MRLEKRKKNLKLRRQIKAMPCVVCGSRNCDPCHIAPWGRTQIDSEWNILPMCRLHHSEQHAKNWDRMMEKYPRLKLILSVMGWSWGTTNGKFKMFHDGLLEEK